ncbi:MULTISPECIES: ABC transporter permease [unclassified Microcella]|uniref:ABC transporter permease n=1 Tax=unclassified Microcella TaxID=2630066 RepID=UPI0006FC638C|nr:MULTISPECIES: ABC transporter permease [unclassified Microcella]KQV26004.1 hypothetical protein ASC54_03395 [Yonghaparkia sp. Root332]KRF33190.1 hypothetical protein ASG83_04255 [Yonghaparkia sp. Soil809]
MLIFTAKRVLSGLIVLLVASVVIFFILRLAPGDPAAALAGADADQATIDAIRTRLGLDLPLWQQYASWLGGILTGNLGDSFILSAPIAELIGDSLPNTVFLAGGALLLALVGGAVVGIVLGVSRRRAVNSVFTAANSVAFAVPPYVTGVFLTLVFSIYLGVLPSGGVGPGLGDPVGAIPYLLLPAVTLALPTGATIARFLAASMRRQREEDFVQAGIAKGLTTTTLFARHVIPNSLPPVLTVLGIQIGQLLAGAIIVEVVFAWPGVGQLILQSVITRDYLLTQVLLLLAVAVFVVMQTLTDLADAALDPRVRMGIR